MLKTSSKDFLNLLLFQPSHHCLVDEINIDELDLDALERELVPTPIRNKSIALELMDDEEAITALELLGHDFYIYKSQETNKVNVVYLRNDGRYGIIETE